MSRITKADNGPIEANAKELEAIASAGINLLERLEGLLNRFGEIEPTALVIEGCCGRPPCSECAATCLIDHLVARAELAAQGATTRKPWAALVTALHDAQKLIRQMNTEAQANRYGLHGYQRWLGRARQDLDEAMASSCRAVTMRARLRRTAA